MESFRLDNIQIYDVDQNDRYDPGIDLINTLEDKPLRPDGPEIKGLLQRLGIDSFQRINSLRALSRHLGCLRAAEEMATRGALEDIQSNLDCAMNFAWKANLPFRLDAKPFFKKAYQKQIEDAFQEADEEAKKGEPTKVKNLTLKIKLFSARGEIGFDEVRAEKIMRKALSFQAERLLQKALDADQKAQWGSVVFFLKEAQSAAKASGTGLSYPGTKEILNKAYRSLWNACLERAEKSALAGGAFEVMQELENANEWREILKIEPEELAFRKRNIVEKLTPEGIRKGLNDLYQRAEERLKMKQYRVAEAEGLIDRVQSYGEFFNIDPDLTHAERILKIAEQNEKRGKRK